MSPLNSFLASRLAIVVLLCSVGNALAQPGPIDTNIQQLLAGSSRVVILPVPANYYRGHPNLKLAFKKNLSWYESPELYKERYDDDSARIAEDLATLLMTEISNRGFAARILQDEMSDEAVTTLHGAYWPGLLHNGMLAVIEPKEGVDKRDFVLDAGEAARQYVETRREKGAVPFSGSDTLDSDRIAMVTSIATQAEADTLVIARFWGWRKRSGAIPSMGAKKSAATLWVGLIDGTNGNLIAVGQNNTHSPFVASKQRDDKLAKMVTSVLSSLVVLPAAGDRDSSE